MTASAPSTKPQMHKDENKENELPDGNHINRGVKDQRADNVLSHSAPRQRQPLRAIDPNTGMRSSQLVIATPVLEGARPERKCATEPAKSSHPPSSDSTVKRSLEAEGAKKKKAKPAWQYADDRLGAIQIAAELAIDAPEAVQNPVQLFEHLEQAGQLAPTVLKLFARCPGILTMNLSPTYGSQVNEAGLMTQSAQPSKGCTVPLYSGYRQLLALDLTNIEVSDDEIRYLIKLDSLQALGLSGTKITGKALKFMAAHASFLGSLQCMKLCYNGAINDDCLQWIRMFKGLQELDLLGTAITYEGTVQAFTEASLVQLQQLRLPVAVTDRLDDLHTAYANTAPIENIDKMAATAIKASLTKHKKHYSNIYPGLEITELRKTLQRVALRRQTEEWLWCLCDSFASQ